MQNFCGKCGAKLSGSNEFCTNCGAKIMDDKESGKEEIKKENKVEIKAEEKPDKKDSPTAPPKIPPSFTQSSSFDPKIKEISILVIVLVCSLFLAGIIFNFPIKNSLSFDPTEKGEIEDFYNSVYKEIYFQSWGIYPFTYSPIQLAKIMEDINKASAKYYPLINFEVLWKVTALILLLIVVSFGANELMKDPNKLKWLIISSILIIGIAYSLIVSTRSNVFTSSTNKYLLYILLFLSFSILFSTLAFYQKKDIKLWIFTSAIVSLVVAISSGAFNKPEVIEKYLNIQFSTFFYYIFRYLYVSAFIVLPSLTFYYFLKNFIYEQTPESADDSTMKVYSKEEYNDFRDRMLRRK